MNSAGGCTLRFSNIEAVCARMVYNQTLYLVDACHSGHRISPELSTGAAWHCTGACRPRQLLHAVARPCKATSRPEQHILTLNGRGCSCVRVVLGKILDMFIMMHHGHELLGDAFDCRHRVDARARSTAADKTN